MNNLFPTIPHPGRAVAVVLSFCLVGTAACDDPAITGPDPTSVTWQALDSGPFRSCGVNQDGNVYCWGRGAAAVSNDDSVAVALTPLQVPGAPRLASIAVGGGHSCGVTIAGGIVCWGQAIRGQLGNASLEFSATPVNVRRTGPWTVTTAGLKHNCAITIDMDPFCWGWNSRGQLGVGTTIGLWSPEPVDTDLRFTDVSAGRETTCGVAADNMAHCWGSNSAGQLGTGDTLRQVSPTPVGGGHRFSTIDVGVDHACGVTVGGEIYCWGRGEEGQLGDGNRTASLLPVRVDADPDYLFRDVTAGWAHTCALTEDDKAYCWGQNSFGRLGNGGVNRVYPQPVLVETPVRFRDISAGQLHTCALSSHGVVYCWGFGGYGQLGTGTTLNAPFPVPIADPEP